jgi:arylsulfatase A-like enzyme
VAPHAPSIAEPRYASATVPAHQPDPSYMEADRADKPPFVRSQNQTAAAAQATRTAMIRTLYTVDDQVDRLMRHLQATGELASTLVIFTSDNGFLQGEHRTTEKFLPYRKAVEVPFLIRWPGRVPAGAVDDRLVTHVDVLPTILAATGVTQTHATLDGRDLLSGHTSGTSASPTAGPGSRCCCKRRCGTPARNAQHGTLPARNARVPFTQRGTPGSGTWPPEGESSPRADMVLVVVHSHSHSHSQDDWRATTR